SSRSTSSRWPTARAGSCCPPTRCSRERPSSSPTPSAPSSSAGGWARGASSPSPSPRVGGGSSPRPPPPPTRWAGGAPWPARPRAKAVRQPSPTAALDPTLSRDGKKLFYVQDWDLHLLDIASGKERRLTTGGGERLTHGLAEFVAEEEMDRHAGAWWSPDGSQL